MKNHLPDKDLTNIKLAYERDGISSQTFAIYAVTAPSDPSEDIIAVYNEQGIVVESFIRDADGLNRSDRDYFLVHRDTDSKKLDIGKPLIGRISGQTSFP